MRKRRALLLVFSCAIAAPERGARADVPSRFGFGSKSEAFAGADVADPSPALAAHLNPAAASRTGTRVALGYDARAVRFTIDGARADLPSGSGATFGIQVGGRVAPDVRVGAALAMFVPNSSIARITFEPATEPQFVLDEGERLSVDAALAAAYRNVAMGLGIAAASDLTNSSVALRIATSAGGAASADGASDLALRYHLAPTAGLLVDLGRATVAARYRGALATDVALDTTVDIALPGNPLNGHATIPVRGTSGYVPASFDLASKATLVPGVTALLDVAYQRYSRMPSPVAQVEPVLALDSVPAQLGARFVEPRLHDTLSAHVGLAVDLPLEGPPEWQLRAGYAFSPTPVPEQTGLTSYADASRHTFALGAGHDFGVLAGIQWSADAAVVWQKMVERSEKKPDPSLPFSSFTVAGDSWTGALTVEATWL